MAPAFEWLTVSATSGSQEAAGRFWLTQSAVPLTARAVVAAKIATWDSDLLPSLTVTAVRPGTNEVAVPAGTTHVRVDFELTVTAKGVTTTGLAIRQLFSVGAQGVFLPLEHSLDSRPWTPSPQGPVRAGSAGPSTRRQLLGLHPLLKAVPAGFTVDARFLDVTELWWQIHKDKSGRYLHPALNARIENLRVLAWTGGDLPTVWFAVLSDAAVTSLRVPDADPPKADVDPKVGSRGPADIVWMRPSGGGNAFAYAPTVGGFEAPRHDDTTWLNLARWLLAPAPKDQLSSVRTLSNYEQVQDQMLSLKAVSATPLRDAMTMAWSHRPVGLERVLSRTGRADLVLLPLGANTGVGYAAATRGGLAARVAAARTLLWSTGVAGRLDREPAATGRQLWLAAHSGGNFSLATALAANASSVARVISHDPSGNPSPLPGLLAHIAKESGRRAAAGIPPLETVFIVTPHMTGDPAGLTAAVRKQIDATGAKVRHLPDPAGAVEFWRIPPKAKSAATAGGTLGTPSATAMIEDSSNPYMRYFFENYSDRELYDAKGNATVTFRDFRIWLVHEMSVFAGHLDPLPPNLPPDPPRTTRTFVEDSFAPF